MSKKIFIHSYSGYTPFFKEVIAHAKESGLPIEWGILLYSNGQGYLDDVKKMVDEDNVLYLQEKLNRYMRDSRTDLDLLKDFPVSVYQCIGTSKVMEGHISIPLSPRSYQQKLIVSTYKAYREFLEARRPDFVFFPTIESYDSFILLYLCKELAITPVIYGHARNLGVSYFTDAVGEPLPRYAFSHPLSAEDRKKARDFIDDFRKEFKPSFVIKDEPKAEDRVEAPGLEMNIVEKAFEFLRRRLMRFEPHVVDRYTLVHNLKIHFHPLTMKYRQIKAALIYQRLCDVKTVHDLPQKFMYYPLQYSPESSINVPAPFFVDQLRTVDLILFAMPPDYQLVVKEHPAMRAERPLSFYRELRKKAGVVVVDYSVRSIDVIKRAALTISVTGTSALEAFLLGKPSIHIARAFFSDWIFTFDSFWDFKSLIKRAIATPALPEEDILDLVGRTLKIGANFHVYPAGGGPYGRLDVLMNKKNIDAMLTALLQHIDRLTELKN